MHPGRPTLVLDLDETLSHTDCQQRVHLRPAVAPFLLQLSAIFEIVVFTASDRLHADPVLDALSAATIDYAHTNANEKSRELIELVANASFCEATLAAAQRAATEAAETCLSVARGPIEHRLYREHCDSMGNFILKDLRRLGRDMGRTLLVDNSPESFALLPENGVPIEPFFGAQVNTAV